MFKEISKTEIQLARQALCLLDTSLFKANEAIPIDDWRTKEGGFKGLVRLILEQQVSVASANAIWNRLEVGLGIVEPQQILTKTIEELKGYGLSTPKARYVHGVALAHEQGEVDFNELKDLDDKVAIAKLTALKGIGRWTAEVYLMFCEARRDVFPAADLALQEAIRILDSVAHRPSTEELYSRSEMWSPYRSFAAHLLWGYYRAIKKNIIPMPQGVPLLIKSIR
ncbi:DNA-3-methyladenine glycosylase [Legionella massiliensis]|uniref:DNA-3-methyladenine glycosylase II n=1 Tax=Legionella massiliensis TaxID=1034943 RepID=A0A078KXA6_9GAMM|nr:DNA-3-methyladenine glycosylase [Legionella massiliensis]CDZ76404.1 DNA-3-methyladenine glycosylase [Legionella massiliensis]CEE12142.1 DNA-3-methyladenine glycosylase [Legionella massiliensis]